MWKVERKEFKYRFRRGVLYIAFAIAVANIFWAFGDLVYIGYHFNRQSYEREMRMINAERGYN